MVGEAHNLDAVGDPDRVAVDRRAEREDRPSRARPAAASQTRSISAAWPSITVVLKVSSTRVRSASARAGRRRRVAREPVAYVREDEWDGLAPEIRRYEPREALVSGADGLDAIRELAAAPAGTRLALEHAPAQAAAVRALMRDARTLRDLAGREHVTVGRAA